MTNKICIVCNNNYSLEAANEFARQFQLPLHNQKSKDFDLQLCFDDKHILLFDTQLNTSIVVDFIHGASAHREKFGGGKGQSIAKAIGLNKFKNPNVIDVTAGLARDAYVLACLGCKLTLIEKSPILSLLIKDGVDRAMSSESDHSVGNITEVINADSQRYIMEHGAKLNADVIYMDPMYPERKKNALVKKDMQILHKLIGGSDNEAQLLDTALEHAKKRVVVKRPTQAPNVSDKKPTMSIHSKKTRYDVYITG